MKEVCLNMTQENERLTDDEIISLKKQGTSQGFTVPAAWIKTIRGLKREPLMFYAHVEKDLNGSIYIVFQKARLTPTERKPVDGR
jgi:hypothetical protein